MTEQQTRFDPATEAAFDRHTRRFDAGIVLTLLVPMLMVLLGAILLSAGWIVSGIIALCSIPVWVVAGVRMM